MPCALCSGGLRARSWWDQLQLPFTSLGVTPLIGPGNQGSERLSGRAQQSLGRKLFSSSHSLCESYLSRSSPCASVSLPVKWGYNGACMPIVGMC